MLLLPEAVPPGAARYGVEGEIEFDIVLCVEGVGAVVELLLVEVEALYGAADGEPIGIDLKEQLAEPAVVGEGEGVVLKVIVVESSLLPAVDELLHDLVGPRLAEEDGGQVDREHLPVVADLHQPLQPAHPKVHHRPLLPILLQTRQVCVVARHKLARDHWPVLLLLGNLPDRVILLVLAEHVFVLGKRLQVGDVHRVVGTAALQLPLHAPLGVPDVLSLKDIAGADWRKLSLKVGG